MPKKHAKKTKTRRPKHMKRNKHKSKRKLKRRTMRRRTTRHRHDRLHTPKGGRWEQPTAESRLPIFLDT